MKTPYEYQKKYRKSHPEVRRRNRKKNYEQSLEGARNSKELWTQHEDAAVLAHEITDRELAKKIGRSVQAIQIRRARLKKGSE